MRVMSDYLDEILRLKTLIYFSSIEFCNQSFMILFHFCRLQEYFPKILLNKCRILLTPFELFVHHQQIAP